MTTIAQPRYLSMLDEDLYRLGNASSPRLDNVRYPKDVQTYDRNGVMMVRAKGFGVSLVTEARLKRIVPMSKGSYAWKLPPNYPMPPGLVLVPDTGSARNPGDEPDHYFLSPISDMTLSEYVGLLSKLALKLERVRKL